MRGTWAAMLLFSACATSDPADVDDDGPHWLPGPSSPPAVPSPLVLDGPLPQEAAVRLGRSRHGPLGPADLAAWSPDGTLVAVARGRDVALWDPRRLTRVKTWAPLPDRPAWIAFSPHDHLVVAGTAAGLVALPVLHEAAPVHPAATVAGAFDPGGGRLATASADGVVTVWDAARWTPIASRGMGDGDPVDAPPPGVPRAVSWHPADPAVAVLDDAGVVRLVDADSLRVRHRWQAAHAQWLAWTPDGRDLVVGEAGGAVLRVDPTDGRPRARRCPAPCGEAGGDVAASPVPVAADRVAVGQDDGSVVVADLVRRVDRRLPGAGRPLALSPDGDTLLAASRDGVRLWDVAGGTPITAGALDPAAGHAGAVTGIATFGRLILTASAEDQRLHVWDATGGHLAVARGCELRAFRCGGAPALDGRRVRWGQRSWTLGDDGRLRDEQPAPFDGFARARGPVGGLVAVAGGDHLRLEHTDGATVLPVVDVPDAGRWPVRGLAFHEDGASLVTWGDDVRVWAASGELLETWTPGDVVDVRLDGDLLQVLVSAGEIHRYDLEARAPAGVLPLPLRPTVAAWTDDALALGDADGRVVVLAPDLRTVVRALRAHDDAVTAIALSPGGRLVTGSADGTAVVWSAVEDVVGRR